jgi:hypothetical protein
LRLTAVLGGQVNLPLGPRIAAAGLALLLLAGCDDLWREYTGGVSGYSFAVAEQFVILQNGYKQGDVTWVVVRNWPLASSAEQRLSDVRLKLSLEDGEYYITQPGGAVARPVPGTAYVFDGPRLTSFRIRMKEDDFIGFRSIAMKAYPDVEAFLRRFQSEAGR